MKISNLSIKLTFCRSQALYYLPCSTSILTSLPLSSYFHLFIALIFPSGSVCLHLTFCHLPQHGTTKVAQYGVWLVESFPRGGDAFCLSGVKLADGTEHVKLTQPAEAISHRSLFTCTWTRHVSGCQNSSHQSGVLRGVLPAREPAAFDPCDRGI